MSMLNNFFLNGLNAALDNAPSFIYVKNRKLEYIYGNVQTLKLFNCSMEDLYLSSDSNFFPSSSVRQIKENDLKALSGACTEMELIVDDGTNKRVYLCVNTPIYSDTKHIIGVLGIATDITIQKELTERALNLAKTDVLTGLVNRLDLDTKLCQEAERCKRYHEPLSIILVDIDHFKIVNDNYGHLSGDRCLIHIANILSNHSRITDTVSRWGGEEFLILCPQTNLKSAIDFAERYRTLINQHVFPEVNQISASFGVTTFHSSDTVEAFITRADQALYKAKNMGRNRVEAIEYHSTENMM